jgi:hypothetical protein
MSKGDGQIGFPVEKKQYDLSAEPRDSKYAPTLSHDESKHRSPAALMRQMGFDPNKHMTPLQFLVAVMNDETGLIFKRDNRRKRIEDKGGIALSYRVEAAKTAAKYMHMEMPKITYEDKGVEKFGEDLARNIAAGNERVITKRMILETVERISPDIPLPPASYPPSFQNDIEVTELRDLEGDTDYDPDTQ